MQSPIGKFILLSCQEPEILEDPLLQEKLENLVDLIKLRTASRGFEQTSQSLQGELFSVRIDLLSHLLNRPEILRSLENMVLEEIAEKYFLKGPNKQLGLVVSDSLEVYLAVFSRVPDLIVKQEDEDFSKLEIPSFEALKLVLLLQATPESANYVKWLESSLNFDYLLIVADLYLQQEIQLEVDQVRELEQLIRKAIVEFASYSALTGFWNIQGAEDLPYFDEISSRVATFQLEESPTIYTPSPISKPKEKSANDFLDLWSKSDADLIEKAIHEGCEQIDEDDWN